METKAFYSYFSSYSHANYTWIYLDIPRYKYIVEICLRTTDVIINLIYMCLIQGVASPEGHGTFA